MSAANTILKEKYSKIIIPTINTSVDHTVDSNSCEEKKRKFKKIKVFKNLIIERLHDFYVKMLKDYAVTSLGLALAHMAQLVGMSSPCTETLWLEFLVRVPTWVAGGI